MSSTNSQIMYHVILLILKTQEKTKKNLKYFRHFPYNFTKHFYRTDLDFDLEKETIISLVN